MDVLTFTGLIGALAGLTCDLDPRHLYQDSISDSLSDGAVFDFIVVGGGSAGCVVASRLAENPNYSVLLIEIGGFPKPLTEVPAVGDPSKVYNDSAFLFPMEQNNIAKAYPYSKPIIKTGKVLGGGSTINGMIYIRNGEEIYDKWKDMGNSEWGWNDVKPYFAKSQKSVGRDDLGDRGPLVTTYTPSTSRIRNVLLRALKQSGYRFFNNETNTGSFESLSTIVNGSRCSTAKAYLANQRRPNLFLALNAEVTKIHISDDRATGVQVTIKNHSIRLNAQREVILSAGTFGSPKLLMLSGIGPRQHLQEKAIVVKADLPVGKNYQDHYGIGFIFVKLNPLNNHINTIRSLIEDGINYCKTGTGSFGMYGITNIANFIRTNSNETSSNLQMIFAHQPNIPSGSERPKSLEFRDEVQTVLDEQLRKTDILRGVLVGLKPKSRGEVLLNTTNPSDLPIIKGNYMSDPEGYDRRILIEGINHFKRIIATPSLAKFEAKIMKMPLKDCKPNEDYWSCYITNFGGTKLHPVGTCKMGPTNDGTNVVDQHLRVFEIRGLRVIDASIMPVIVPANTNAATIMIAEKASDMIKNENSV